MIVGFGLPSASHTSTKGYPRNTGTSEARLASLMTGLTWKDIGNTQGYARFVDNVIVTISVII